jgi:hypothetical protein
MYIINTLSLPCCSYLSIQHCNGSSGSKRTILKTTTSQHQHHTNHTQADKKKLDRPSVIFSHLMAIRVCGGLGWLDVDLHIQSPSRESGRCIAKQEREEEDVLHDNASGLLLFGSDVDADLAEKINHPVTWLRRKKD